MKKSKKLLSFLLCAVMVLSCVAVGGIDIDVSGIKANAEASGIYTYSVIDGEVTITGCDKNAAGKIEIPSVIEGYPVTSVEAMAFYYCNNIESIYVPDSIISIGENAFLDILNVSYTENMKADGKPWGAKYINGFTDNGIVYTDSSMEELVLASEKLSGDIILPDSVKTIRDQAFFGCSHITGITIPEKVTQLGYAVFESCSSLKKVTLPDSITYIGDNTFEDCGLLADITIPNGVTYIGKNAFGFCHALTNLNVPDSVTAIGDDAFWEIPNISYSKISGVDFGRYGAKCINGYVEGGLVYSDSSKKELVCASRYISGGIILPDSVEVVSIYAFENCFTLTSIHIPSGITEIGTGSFWNCRELEYICSDTNDCYAKTYAGNNGIEFKVCSGHCTKEEAIAELNEFLENVKSDEAKEIINTATEEIEKSAEFDAKSIAFNAENEAENADTALENAKTAAKTELEEAKKDYNSDEAKAAVDEAIAEIDKATNQDAVASAKATGMNNAENADTALANAIIEAKAECEAAKEYIISDKAREIIDKTLEELDSCTSLSAIDNLLNEADRALIEAERELINARDAAKTELEDAKKNAVSDEAKAALDEAIANVDKAANPDAVASSKTSGITNAENADTALENAKADAKAELEEAKNNAASDEAKAALNEAIESIDNATNLNAVASAKTTGITKAENADKQAMLDIAEIKVADAQTVDYRSIVTITATAENVPEGYILAIYVDGKKVAGDNNKSVTYSAGELKSDINYTVKVIDANGNVQKTSEGKELSAEGGKITCNKNFFIIIIAFFKGLFGKLPKAEIIPQIN